MNLFPIQISYYCKAEILASGVTQKNTARSFNKRNRMVSSLVYVDCDGDGVSLNEGFSPLFRRKVFDAFREVYDKLFIRHKTWLCFNMVDCTFHGWAGISKTEWPEKSVFCGKKKNPKNEMCLDCRRDQVMPRIWSKQNSSCCAS